MANSLIEDILNEQPINDGKKNKSQKPPKMGKKKSKKIFVIIFILIILIVCALGAIYYLQNNKEVVSNKAKFFEVLANNNIEEVSNVDLYQEVLGKLVSEDSNITTQISMDLSDISSGLENMNFSLETQNDIDNGISHSDISWNYSDIELLSLELLVTSQAIGFTSPEIVQPYVGFSYDYILESAELTVDSAITDLEDYSDYYDTSIEEDETYEYDVETEDSVSEEIDETTESETSTEETSEESDYEIISSSVYDGEEEDASTSLEDLDMASIIEALENMETPTISETSKKIYKDIIDQNIDESAFTSKEVTLQMDSGNVDCTEYSVTISEAKFVNIIKEVLMAFETDTEILDSISQIMELFGIDNSYVISAVDEIITELENAEVSDSENIVIKVYDNNGQTVQIAMEYSGIKMEIEYGYGDSENYIKITAIEDETSDGVTYKITNVNSDLKSELNIEFSQIEAGVVTNTLKIESSVVKSGTTYKVVLGIYYQSEDMDLSVDISSDVTFESVELEEPVYGEEFVILDELDEETMNSLVEQIGEQITSVVSDNITQILLGTVTSNSGTTVIQQMEAGNDSSNDGEEISEEEQTAQSALQAEIDAMKQEKEANSEELTLSDLEDLEIDGYIVQVEIGEDLAIVTMGDYIFNVDSEFQISN